MDTLINITQIITRHILFKYPKHILAYWVTILSCGVSAMASAATILSLDTLWHITNSAVQELGNTLAKPYQIYWGRRRSDIQPTQKASDGY